MRHSRNLERSEGFTTEGAEITENKIRIRKVSRKERKKESDL